MNQDPLTPRQFAAVNVAINLISDGTFLSKAIHSTAEESWTSRVGKQAAEITNTMFDHLDEPATTSDKGMAELREKWLPRQRVEGTIDPSAPMPYNKEDLKGLDIDSMMERAAQKVVDRVLDDEARADIADQLGKIIGSVTRFEPVKETDSLIEVLHKVIKELKQDATGIEVRSLKYDLTLQKVAVKELDALNGNLREQIHNLSKTCDKLQEQNCGMGYDLKSQTSTIDRLQREVAALNANLLAARTVNSRYEGALKSAKEKLENTSRYLQKRTEKGEAVSGWKEDVDKSLDTVNDALHGSAKEAPTINEEPPAPIWTPWESSTRVVLMDGVTVAVAYDRLQAEHFVKEHNAEMERVSKR